MTTHEAATAPAPVERASSTLTWGGGGVAVAGALQALGGLNMAIPGAVPGLQVLGWLVGGIVLLLASVLLAVGWRAEEGLVGRSAWRRGALILSSTGSLFMIAVFIVAWTVGPALWGLTVPELAVVQLLILITTAAVAVTVLRGGAITGPTRWAFVCLAAVDAVAFVLAAVPPLFIESQYVVGIARPLVLLAVGALLWRHGRMVQEKA